MYIADQAGIQSILSGGSLVTLIHGGPGAVATILDRQTALQADAVAVDREGDIYVGDESPKLLIEFSPSGHVLKSWSMYVTPGGLTATTDGDCLSPITARSR